MLPTKATTPDPVAPSTGSAPATSYPSKPVKSLTGDDLGKWRKRVQGALDGTKAAIDTGRQNIYRYQGKYLSVVPTDDTILVPTDFYYIEQKRSQLFYRLPDVYLEPLQPGVDDACVILQAALNRKMGPQGIHILPTVQQVLFDVLCPTGFGAVKVGYQVVQDGEAPVQVGMEPDPDAPPPAPRPGSILQLAGPAMRPKMQMAPNLIAKWYYATRIRPGDLIVPPDFDGTDFDEAPYLGMRFKEDVPDGTEGSSTSQSLTDDERRLTPLSEAATAQQGAQRTGYEIWYKAALFDADVKHPDTIRCFRYYDGEDVTTSVDVQDHPFATYDQTGKLIAGMRGYPINPLTIRYVSDTWMAPSDCTMARPLADELSRGRTQMIQFRARSVPQVGYDSTKVTREDLQKIQRNETGAFIGFDGPFAEATWPIVKGDFKRESFQFNDYVQRDLDQVWSLGPNPGGALAATSRTATEQQIAQMSAQSRLDMERNVVLSWYVDKVVTKFASLLQMFADQTEFVTLVGSDAQRLTKIPPQVAQQAQQTQQDPHTLVPWNKDTIQGQFLFRARPDSQLYLDTAQRRKQLMDLYNFFAHNPMVNAAELTREILAEYGFDPSKLLQPPPPKSPEPPKATLAFQAATDLNPFQPQYQNVKAALEALGVQGLVPPAVDPATAQAMAQLTKGPASATQHGGAAILAEKVSQHPLNQTGGMQGTGQPAPIAPGGQR